MHISRYWTALALVGTLLATTLLYLPGVHAPFRFDDFSNLRDLAFFASQPGWDAARFYLESAGAGPLGRPLSLLTFLPQASAFPGNPAAFHWVNLIIHLVCGALVFQLTAMLGKALGYEKDRYLLVALLAAAAWLMQPMFVSTVLYAVQRMAQLATLFCLAGVIAWLHGRQIALSGNIRRGAILATVGAATCLAAGLLSKENAAVLPLLILVVEAILPTVNSEWKKFRLWALGVPLTVGLVLLAILAESLVIEPYASRNFSLAERLLTQTRVLWEYLGLLLLPVPQQLGLIADDIAVSRGVLTPVTTLVAGLAWCVAVVIAWRYRSKQPGLALALFWFLAAHAVESGPFPLEIYFEHRNYLPAAGFYAGLALAAIQLLRRILPRLAVAAWLLLLVTLLLGQALLWGNPESHATTRLAQHPGSLRAHLFMADTLQHQAGAEPAVEFLRRTVRKFPDAVEPASSLVTFACLRPDIDAPEMDRVIGAFSNGRFSYLPLSHLDRMITVKAQDGCENLSLDELRSLVHALDSNPRFHTSDKARRYLHVLDARLLHQQGKLDEAVKDIEAAASIDETSDLWLQAAWWAMDAGRISLAEGLLDRAQESASSPLDQKRVTAMREELQRQATTQ